MNFRHRTIRYRTVLLALALFCLPFETAARDDPTRIEAADLYRLSVVANPQVAPDGRHVVFERSFFDILSDRQLPELRLARITAEGLDEQLLIGAGEQASSARWAPDSRRVAFVAWNGPAARLYVIDIDEGIARPVAVLNSPGRELAWSPDGRRIAFTDVVETPPPPIKGMPEKPAGASWAPDARLVTRFHYREDGNYAAGDSGLLKGRRHLFVAAAESGRLRQLTSGDALEADANGRLVWSKDGGSIIFASLPRPEPSSRNNDLYRIPASGGVPRKLTGGTGAKLDPALSPDGRSVAYIGIADRPGLHSRAELWVTPVEGGEARNLTADLDLPVQRPIWTADGRGIYVLYDQAGHVRLASIPLGGGHPRVVDADVGSAETVWPYTDGAQYSAAQGTLAHLTAHEDGPAGLAVLRRGKRVGAFDFNSRWRAGKSLGALKEIRYRSAADGREIHGWALFPPGVDAAAGDSVREYPLILEIHGGPIAAYGPRFAFKHQMFAAAGYVVLFVNPRGSIGYGDAFASAYDDEPYFGKAYADLMSGVDAMSRSPYVDADRLFVTGASAGGTLTLWTIGTTNRFRAAAAWEPATDWTMQVLVSETPGFYARYEVGALPWEDHARYWARSPLALAGNVETPTLLVIGETDLVTPTVQTDAYYSALKMRGVDAAMLRLPEAGHWLGRPSQWLAGILTTIDWFDRHKAVDR